MSGAFYIGAVGLDAQQKALDTIANNISNINTAGFKRTEVRFTEVLASQPDGGIPRADLGASSITSAGVRSDALFMINEQGQLEKTGSQLDVAISGAGFIELMGPAGQTLLWRGGALKADEEGRLMTTAGLELKSGITLPGDATAIEIGSDGIVRAKTATGEEFVKVDDPSQVDRIDGGLYRVKDSAQLDAAVAGEDGLGVLVQGAIERSTVELNQEMVELMMVQRAYSANAQIVQAADQLMGLANGLRR